MKPLFSIILPIKNEADSLPQLITELTKTLKGENYEIIAVNDASTDDTAITLAALMVKIPRLTVISLESPGGKWATIREGLTRAGGDYIITLDSDLQDDPKELPKLIKKSDRGFDIVSGWRQNRQDLWYKVVITNVGNKVISFLTRHNFHDFGSPFKIYRRTIIHQLPLHGSLFRYSLLFAQKLNMKITEVPVVHRPRIYGQSKFGLAKYFRILYDLALIMLLFTGSGRLERAK